MGYVIRIEDLIANALIESIERTGKRTLTSDQLENYEKVVVSNLQSEGIDVTFAFSCITVVHFLERYAAYFRLTELENGWRISLPDEISTEFLKKNFRIHIPLRVLPSFVANNAIQTLIEEKQNESKV